ncbi:hypothetical protein HQ590_11240 [bacterium]|nr:hypothetical protein [bacterium]
MVTKDPQDWYARGRLEGQAVKHHLAVTVQEQLDWTRQDLPQTASKDYLQELQALNEERLEAEPNYTAYPELKGLKACYREQQRGFLEGAGCTNREMAFHYNYYWYLTRRLYTRHVGTQTAADHHCSTVYIKNSAEGPLLGRNTDDIVRPSYRSVIARHPSDIPRGKNFLINSGQSSSLLADDEPAEMFPAAPLELMPEETKADIRRVVDFLRRYNEFWGPGNSLMIDSQMNSVVLEKSNCALGVRWPTNGCSASSACFYLTPEMKALKLERDRLSLQRRGWDETAPDWLFWQQCRARYEKLLELAEQENDRGATLPGVAATMLHHGAGAIYQEGNKVHPDLFDVTRTLTSWSAVLTGPDRRMLYWTHRDPTPFYRTKPYLIPGQGVAVKEEWKTGTVPPPAGEPLSDGITGYGLI